MLYKNDNCVWIVRILIKWIIWKNLPIQTFHHSIALVSGVNIRALQTGRNTGKLTPDQLDLSFFLIELMNIDIMYLLGSGIFWSHNNMWLIKYILLDFLLLIYTDALTWFIRFSLRRNQLSILLKVQKRGHFYFLSA